MTRRRFWRQGSFGRGGRCQRRFYGRHRCWLHERRSECRRCRKLGTRRGDFIVRGIGSDFGDFGDFGVEFGDVKSSEARFELVFKVGFGLGDEFIFLATLWRREVRIVMSSGFFEVRIVRPFWHGSASIGRWFCACFEEVCFGLSEIDGPSGFGVDVVGFLVSKRVKGVSRLGYGGSMRMKKSVLFFGEEG